MAKETLKIESILGGISPSQYYFSDGQYLGAVGIDPDYPLTSSDIKTSASLIPVVYEDFSSTNLSGHAKWIVTNPKNTNVYVYASDGKFISYSSALTSGSETLIGTPTSGAGNGAAYYNNYIYLATPTQIFRYGPLDGAAALSNALIANGELLDNWDSGSDTLLTNTTYPSFRGVSVPNHAMHVHGDDFLYLCDFKNGQGLIHKIKTSKTTNEGDTNNGSAYNALDLPFGYYPVDIESYDTDLVITALRTTDTTIIQGSAALFFWDTTSSSFYRGPVPIPDPISTALLNVNGIIYIFSGNAQNGFRISRYIGGNSVQDIKYFTEGNPPFAGAVDSLGNRIILGGYTSYTATSASVFSFGSKDAELPQALHNVVYTTSTGASPIVSAAKYVQQANNVTPRCIAAWKDDAGTGLDKLSTTGTYKSVWRSKMFVMNSKFTIKELKIPFGAAVGANMSIIPKIHIDDGSIVTTLSTINNTNFSGSRNIKYKQPEITDSNGVNTTGENNFFIEFTWGGTSPLPVLFPIEIVIDTFEDEPRG